MNMRVQVILTAENASWIIGKIAERLVGELRLLGMDAVIGREPDPSADVNHWMSYATVSGRAGRVSTMFITHIDDPYKTAHLSALLESSVDAGLCMSRDMMRALVEWGVPPDGLWYVLPAFDAPPDGARIRIAITTRLYPDGRKREALLQRLALDCDLSPFHFEIAGGGWDAVAGDLRRAGASVRWNEGSADYQSDYSDILRSMRECEYYLYLGMDEGSLGTLDALALGLKTIVTPQGFHLDIPGGITIPVTTYEQFREAMTTLAAERELRRSSVRDWTWAAYAREHVRIWELLATEGRTGLSEAMAGYGRYSQSTTPLSARGLTHRSWSGYYRRALSPLRILDAIARLRAVQPLRRLLRRFRQ